MKEDEQVSVGEERTEDEGRKEGRKDGRKKDEEI